MTSFTQRYDAVMAKWPVPYMTRDLPGRFGRTHVTICGDGPPIVLLHGGRATSAVWYATVGALAPIRRVYAIDIIGDAGRSVLNGEPMRRRDAWMRWLDETLDALEVTSSALAGHSYGGWLALRYAMWTPERISRLVLLDPSESFAPTPPAFRLRSIPLLVRRDPGRWRTFIEWETGARPLDAEFLDLWAGPPPSDAPSAIAFPVRPKRAELALLTMPVLVFVPAHSRQNNPDRLAAAVHRALPQAEVAPIPDATHFTIPQQHPTEINPLLAQFLTPAAPADRS